MTLAETQTARYSIVTVDLPGGESVNAGVLLEDPATDRLWVRMRRDWDAIFPEEADVLAEFEDDLIAKSREMGAARLLAWIEETWSNLFRISDRREVAAEDPDRGSLRSDRLRTPPERRLLQEKSQR